MVECRPIAKPVGGYICGRLHAERIVSGTAYAVDEHVGVALRIGPHGLISVLVAHDCPVHAQCQTAFVHVENWRCVLAAPYRTTHQHGLPVHAVNHVVLVARRVIVFLAALGLHDAHGAVDVIPLSSKQHRGSAGILDGGVDGGRVVGLAVSFRAPPLDGDVRAVERAHNLAAGVEYLLVGPCYDLGAVEVQFHVCPYLAAAAECEFHSLRNGHAQR